VVSATEHKIGLHYNYDLRTDERRALREAIRGKAQKTTLRAAYVGLFEWMGRPDLFKPAGGKLEYVDVFPLIYLKMRLEGIENPRPGVKHLLIDEMQDYTAVQYAVLGRLFKCRKTILGDAAQSINPLRRVDGRRDPAHPPAGGAGEAHEKLPLNVGDHAVRPGSRSQCRTRRHGAAWGAAGGRWLRWEARAVAASSD
jgi:hypothetical protein